MRADVIVATPVTADVSGRFCDNAAAATTQNERCQSSSDGEKGEYETRTEWHRLFAWKNLAKFANTLQKGRLITPEGTLKYREVEDDVEGHTFKHRIAEVHATSMKRLSKIEAQDQPEDGAEDE